MEEETSGGITGALTRPLGPLPAWAWGVVIAGGYLVYRFAKTGSLWGGGSGNTSTSVGGAGPSSGLTASDLSTILGALSTTNNGSGSGSGSGGDTSNGGGGTGSVVDPIVNTINSLILKGYDIQAVNKAMGGYGNNFIPGIPVKRNVQQIDQLNEWIAQGDWQNYVNFYKTYTSQGVSFPSSYQSLYNYWDPQFPDLYTKQPTVVNTSGSNTRAVTSIFTGGTNPDNPAIHSGISAPSYSSPITDYSALQQFIYGSAPEYPEPSYPTFSDTPVEGVFINSPQQLYPSSKGKVNSPYGPPDAHIQSKVKTMGPSGPPAKAV